MIAFAKAISTFQNKTSSSASAAQYVPLLKFTEMYVMKENERFIYFPNISIKFSTSTKPILILFCIRLYKLFPIASIPLFLDALSSARYSLLHAQNVSPFANQELEKAIS